ncbi:MAG TPA: SlyX family protein [Verrucomicrobiae bacterium]|nr:SlyX family protein [Verrucomicrobiae bacterium]
MDLPAETQLERLEAHVAHLEKLYDELNQVVIEQAREINRLRQQLQRVAASIEGMELDRIKATNPKPPHAAI